MGDYAIKWRERTACGPNRKPRPWWFLTPTGGGNRLRVHAATFANEVEAERAKDRIATENPGIDLRVVDLRQPEE